MDLVLRNKEEEWGGGGRGLNNFLHLKREGL